MRTQFHRSLGDVPDNLPECDGMCAPGGGLCCPDDPLNLVLQYFLAPAPAPHETSLAALGIGGSPRHQEQPPPSFGWDQANGGNFRFLGAGTAPGGGGVWEQDSRGSSSRVPEDVEALDIDMYLADAPDGDGDEATICNRSCVTEAMPACGAHAYDALGSVLSNDAPPPLLPPMSAGTLLQNACRAFDGVVPDHAPSLPAPMPAGGDLHARGAPLGVASSALLPMGTLHVCRALVGVVSNDTPPLRMHASPSAWTSPASRTSSGCLTPTSETESPAPVWQPLAWARPRKRRRPPVKCVKRPWSLEFPLHALSVAPPDENPDDNNDNGNDLSKNTCNNVASGIIRCRRPVPRQRNRQAQRVCSHCHSPDTPQWRAGPDGPGTLCNACGIRYAANKLLPEYRPSTAPSFRSDQHSNRHRKVVKLREQKAKETLKVMPNPMPSPSLLPIPPKGNEFMEVCTYISRGL
ncbi:hypothetical protein BAE44_0016765 [Dichanthelium oligosanthes]|uniref:GATA-type domain-containing protein n=1 Tax=Dichanthelium oligosanthes TaxID=888268 RepID=A0A1E5VB12_9POAL|nr:hypothetical protein BAE44_0016765 [Dichanthelium oligosanthes]